MTRRRRPSDDSLEMLLDTICNTFGGVLFLALLVSLLLAQSSRKTAAAATARPAVSTADLVRLESRADAAAKEVAGLQDLRQRLRGMQEVLGGEGVDAARLAELAELEALANEAGAQHAQALVGVAEAQAAAARARQTLAEQRHRSAALAAELAAARTRLAEAQRRARSLAIEAERAAAAPTIDTTAGAPRERETSKREFGILLRFGRLYLMHRHTASGRVVNQAEFVVTPGVVNNTATPRPSQGVDLAAADALDRVAARLQDHPAAGWYPCLVVHPDSFSVFPTLKNWLVAQGYEYRLMPTAEPIVDQGGTGGRVQ